MNLYNFLNLDLNEQFLCVNELDAAYERGEETGNILKICQALIDLELADVIYYDSWRDKWIIKEEM